MTGETDADQRRHGRLGNRNGRAGDERPGEQPGGAADSAEPGPECGERETRSQELLDRDAADECGSDGCEQPEAEERQRGQEARCGRGEPEVGTHVFEQRRQAREHRSQVRAEQDDRDEEQDPGARDIALARGTRCRSVPTTGTVSWIFDIPCDIQHAMVVRGEVARGSVIPERGGPPRIARPSAAADFLLPLASVAGALVLWEVVVRTGLISQNDLPA